MSKPITRVVISVVIALVLVAGIYTSVLGASISVGTKSAHAYNQSSQGLSSFGAGASDQTGSDCHSDSMINPQDY